MPKPHREVQKLGHRNPSAAQIASGTSSTYGGVSGTYSSSTHVDFGKDDDFETTPAPPVVADDRNKPITFGHLQTFWKILLILLPIASAAVWWMSNMSSKVERHEEDIKEVKVRTEKLVNDSASTTVKLEKLDSQVNKLDGQIFEQALARQNK